MDLERLKLQEQLYSKALRKLSYRDRTEKEMREYLQENCDDEEIVDEVFKELKDCAYIDDKRYAKSFYRIKKQALKSDKYIFAELLKKGVCQEAIREALCELEDDFEEHLPSDFEAALLVGQKMLKNQLGEGKPFDEKFKAKVGRRLVALGYSSGVCYKVLDRLKEEAKTDEI